MIAPDLETKLMEYKAAVAVALRTIDELELDGERGTIVLQEVLRAELSITHPNVPAAVEQASPVRGVVGGEQIETSISDDELQAIAHVSDGKVALDVPRALLPDAFAATTREFAVVLPWLGERFNVKVGVEDLRSALNYHGRYDPKNFSTYIRDLDPAFVRYRRDEDRFILMSGGRSRASEIIDRYVGRASS